ncbi:VirD4-like conjugal transfer protein, CD1115 family, partial [Thalassobacillus sp. C254]|uniref:VirD4-like conjugal transfer protein, CD1115 family n=1 Tax=Thalassobacillus sp. C254 TaxID=1225341 RepID=UPI0006D06A65
LYATSKETLEKRGYHVEVLNLVDPLQSMSYQVLQIVIDAYEEGNMAKAEQYAKTISTMLYSDPAAKDKFWQDSASALCTALILGLCEKNIPHHKEKITMYTVANTLNELAAEQEEDEVNGKMITGLDKFFDSLPEHHPAKLQYATVKFASGAGQTVAGIFANAFDKLNIFTLTPIAKMTSKSSFDMKKVGFGKVMSGRTMPLSRVTVHFRKGSASVRTDHNGLFTISHDQKIKVDDSITLKVEKTDIFLELKVTSIQEQSGVVHYEVMQEKTDEEHGLSIERWEQFEKPTALFMITPDYDSSLHVIASLYIKQLYTEVARTASTTKGGKCLREVIFILDEFGNMPAIEDMGSIITVCLGRNIRFNLVIQAYSQLEHKYDKQWKTIDGNCANTLYILTTENETAEAISKKLGERTIASHSRSGGTLSFKKSKTEGTDGRRLLTATELMQLEEGEMVVIRGIKRQDQKRKKIKAYPVYNRGKTRMKYRFEYLADDFDNSRSINDIDISCDHALVSLKEITYRFHEEEEKRLRAIEEMEGRQEKEIPQDTESDHECQAEPEEGPDVFKKESEIPKEEPLPTESVPSSFDQLPLADMFEGEPILQVIWKKVNEENLYTQQEFESLTMEEFIQLLTDLRQQGHVKDHMYQVVIESVEKKKTDYESEENEHEKEPSAVIQ